MHATANKTRPEIYQRNAPARKINGALQKTGKVRCDKPPGSQHLW